VLIGLAIWLTPARFRLLALALGAVVVLLAAAVLWLPTWLVARDTAGAELPAKERASSINGVRATLVQGVVGLAALAGIFVAWQQLQTDREQSRGDRQQLRDQLSLTRQGQVAERFTRAVDQLGSDKLEQRLGGIYGLERIAKESDNSDTRLVTFEVLTAYVHQHSPRDPKTPTRLPGGADTPTPPPDVQAAVAVLGRRTALATDPPLDLRNVDLRGARLSGAKLQGTYFGGAQLQNADFSLAQLRVANFDEAQLQGTSFDGAELQNATFSRAQLQKAHFFGAKLQGTDFFGAQLQGTGFAGAQLEAARFGSARLQNAIFSRAQMQRTDFTGAQLQKADFTGAQLQWANFSRAHLEAANFLNAQLQKAVFFEAELKGALCDRWTTWPDGFDWKSAGVELLSKAPPTSRP
jgi:uncharacterized protein YjbI with pentapeptide repeats